VLPDAVSLRDCEPPEGFASPGSAKAPFYPSSPPPAVTPPIPSPRSEFKITTAAAVSPPPTAAMRTASPQKNTSLDSENEEEEEEEDELQAVLGIRNDFSTDPVPASYVFSDPAPEPNGMCLDLDPA